MEKIYMEENQKKQQKQKQNYKLGFSVVLSFVVAIFAMFSLISFGLATYGTNGGVSYAAPIGTVGNSFTFNTAKEDGTQVWVVSNGSPGFPGFRVPIYLANDSASTPVFCVEAMADVNDGAPYSKDGIIDDYGLLYLLNHSYANGVNVTDATGTDARYVEAWVTQTAIWLYLYETDPTASAETSINHLSAEKITAIQGANSLSIDNPEAGADASRDDFYTGTLYTYVRQLVDDAKSANNTKKLSVSINSDDPASIAEDKSFYQSPKVTVAGNPSEDLTSYDVTVSGVEGAYLVDENGNELNATNVTSGTVFFVRIPAGKVGEETIDVTVNVKGHFNTLTGHYYNATSGDLQKVVSVTGTSMDVSDGATFQIIPTPDTGMSVAQTVYFIGLIVLLCGVGIVYANAKPVESKQ